MFEVPALASLNLGITLPAVTLALGTCILLLVDLWLPEERKETVTPLLALAGITVSFVLALFTYNPEETLALGGMFVGDAFTGFANILALAAAFITVMLSTDYLRRTGIARGEFYLLLLLSTSGAMFMAAANDLIVIFVALELLSIPLYVLAAFRSGDKRQPEQALRSEESGMKYFILGAFSSAFFVYGAALIYGATGTTNLREIFAAVEPVLAAGNSATFLLLAGAGLALVGLGFKVAAVPFHMWTPDVYEGAPTPVTAYMSVAAKIGGFAAMLRLLVTGLVVFTVGSQEAAVWQTVIWVLAAATLILGNLVAISQSNIKRMLAYSSIAHAGYILMAVAAAGTPGQSDQAVQAALIYMLTYLFTNLGAFAVVIAVEKDDGTGTEMEDFVGLARSRPLLAATMAIFMLSLTGIPLTAGFIGKLFVFQAAIQAGLIPLVVIGALTTVVSAFYYVRVIINMYLRDGEGDPAAGATQYVTWAVYATAAGTLAIGIVAPLATNLVSMVTLTY